MDLTGTTDDDDRTLATAWVAGDERAYERIVARHAPMVWRRCRRGLDAADADDATQAVFLVLARRRDKAAASPVLAAWLLTVADMVVRNAHRDRDRRRRAERAAPPPEHHTESSMTDIQDAFRHHLDASLAELPDREREAVVLHHLAGHSLAQVAQATGAGLSTVKERLQRGLDRLRRTLASRGVALGGTALLSCLAAEAAEMPPAGLLVRLRDPASSTAGPGATAGPAANALRWSREGLSPMSRLAIAASITIVLAGSVMVTVAAADPVPDLRLDPRLGEPVVVDPDHAATWTVVSAPDLPRTVARLRTLPEATLLTREADAWLADLERMQSIRMALEHNLLLGRHLARNSFRIDQEVSSLPPERRDAVRTQRYQALLSEASADKVTLGEQRFLGAHHGRIHTGPEGLPVLRRRIDAAKMAGVLVDADEGWAATLPFPPGDALRLRLDDRGLVAGAPETGAVGRILAAIPDGGRTPDDLVLTACVDPGIPGRSLVATATAALTILPDGPRLLVSAFVGEGDAAEGLDPDCFRPVPADAVVAVAMVIRPGQAASSPIVAEVIRALDSAMSPPIAEAIRATVDAIDGTAIAWAEPMMPFPALTVRADLARDRFAILATALVEGAGFVRDDREGVTGLIGPVSLTLGWADGCVTATTMPGGIVSGAVPGGFLAQPEVASSIAEMGAVRPTVAAIVRPAAFTRSIAPLAGMALGSAWANRLAEYQRRQDQAPTPGFLTVHQRGGIVTIHAGGMLAVGAAAAIGVQAAGARVAN
jgi:RNA polymerase sigma factor (sigma-70 family)